MADSFPLLKRLGENIRKYKSIPLQNKDEVLIGRAPNVDYILVATVISRKHAVLKRDQSTNDWYITDLKSLNGILVNEFRLEPYVAHKLKHGDTVQFGVPPDPTSIAEFVFRYCCKDDGEGEDKVDGAMESAKRKRSEASSVDEEQMKKMKIEQEKANKVIQEAEKKLADMQKLLAEKEAEHTEIINKLKQKEERENQAKEAAEENEKKISEMKKLLEEKEKEQACTVNLLKEKEENMKGALQEQKNFQNVGEELYCVCRQEKMEEERKQFNKLLDAQLQEKENLLMQKLKAERDSLEAAKQQVENDLKKEMELKLEEKDKTLQEKLEKEREKLSKVIQNKELEQKMLESQLKETKEENSKQKETMLQIKKNVLSDFTELMETELQCSVCSELFIQATTLNCSHSFCALCISQWMEKKKTCPICRCTIKGHQRAIVLDSYIDKMVEHLSEDLKKTRAEIINSRKDEMVRYVHILNNNIVAGDTPAEPVVIPSDDEDNDDDDDDDDDGPAYESSVEEVYYDDEEIPVAREIRMFLGNEPSDHDSSSSDSDIVSDYEG